MAWKTGTIKLLAAQQIFADVTFDEIKINEKTVGYRAEWAGNTFEDPGLTALCSRLWQLATKEP